MRCKISSGEMERYISQNYEENYCTLPFVSPVMLCNWKNCHTVVSKVKMYVLVIVSFSDYF